MIYLGAITGLLFLLLALSFFIPGTSRESQVFGSARYSKLLTSRWNKGLVVDGKKRITRKQSFVHAVLIAGTGSNKSTAYIMPNILKANGSIIVTDVKSELEPLLAESMKRRGYNVLSLDFGNVYRSHQYNPLALIHTDSQIKSFALQLYDISNNGSTADSGIWRHGAGRIMECMIRCLKQTSPRYHNLANLIRLMHHIEDGSNYIEQFVDNYAPDTETKAIFQSFKNQEAKVKASQLSSAHTAVAILDTQEIKHITAYNTIDFNTLRSQKTCLFLKLPPGASNDSFNVVLTLFFSQLFDYLLKSPLNESDQDLYILADEWGNLKRINGADKAFSLLRSKNCSLSIVLQDKMQLDAVYGHHISHIILSNISNFIAYPGIRGKESLNYVKNLLGHVGFRYFDAHGRPQMSRRELMDTNEIRTMKHGLYIPSGSYAQKIFPTPIYKNGRLMYKHGVYSKNGVLRSKYGSATTSVQTERFVYLTLNSSILSPEETHFEKKLEELFPD